MMPSRDSSFHRVGCRFVTPSLALARAARQATAGKRNRAPASETSLSMPSSPVVASPTSPVSPAPTGPSPDRTRASARRFEDWSLPGDICVENEVDGPVLWLRGEVDGAAVQEFERRWDASPVPLAAIDAGDVTFIDCAGIELLLRWYRASSLLGVAAELRRCSPLVLRLIELAGLEMVFTRAGTVGTA
jgi:anti-anti-sigma factor